MSTTTYKLLFAGTIAISCYAFYSASVPIPAPTPALAPETVENLMTKTEVETIPTITEDLTPVIATTCEIATQTEDDVLCYMINTTHPANTAFAEPRDNPPVHTESFLDCICDGGGGGDSEQTAEVANAINTPEETQQEKNVTSAATYTDEEDLAGYSNLPMSVKPSGFFKAWFGSVAAKT